ncbi:25S rRNA (adenine645-N1)-methyltransferase [Allomyces arbusculus]|nr:25S rRNA (adenine645-N1)-methyltransferase [Allomyces arbusculus]
MGKPDKKQLKLELQQRLARSAAPATKPAASASAESIKKPVGKKAALKQQLKERLNKSAAAAAAPPPKELKKTAGKKAGKKQSPAPQQSAASRSAAAPKKHAAKQKQVAALAKETAVELTKLQAAMQKKLDGAQFRYLNEKLYTMPGTEALQMMQEKPELFELYHAGFRAQAESWPMNPVDRIISEIKEHIKTPATIADLGCGDAMVAQELAPLGYTVRSFDLVAKPPLVEAADMANVPLEDGACDVVVFSLSLMNTNWGVGAAEGARILRKGGIMKIAEVVSRIDDVDAFISALEQIGMSVMTKDTSNPMFIMLTLRKKALKVNKDAAARFQPLKPCIYKRR